LRWRSLSVSSPSSRPISSPIRPKTPRRGAEPPPHLRQARAERAQRGHAQSSGAQVGRRHRQVVEGQLEVVERIEGAADHRVEYGVDDVFLAAPLGHQGREQLSERHPLLVKLQQVRAGDEHVHLHRLGAGVRAEGEDAMPFVGVERARRRAIVPLTVERQAVQGVATGTQSRP
jgi:hypothetical protein